MTAPGSWLRLGPRAAARYKRTDGRSLLDLQKRSRTRSRASGASHVGPAASATWTLRNRR
jgi:hypothetical protein